ncbi:MAG: hypothetical protein Greene041619_100 [Candidatus Peregrinibacteria bacterium Greene0416_19]|nr:MAG: hypothetical protein Greene041619_100 [Candidatus Peregrinibacteria bacterium Greene0416_19]
MSDRPFPGEASLASDADDPKDHVRDVLRESGSPAQIEFFLRVVASRGSLQGVADWQRQEIRGYFREVMRHCDEDSQA